MTVMVIKNYGHYIGYCDKVGGFIYKYGLGFWKVANNEAIPLTPILHNK